MTDQPEWTVLQPEVDDISTGGQKYTPLPDGSMLAGGYAPTKHTREDDASRRTCKNITAFRLELLTDPNLPLGGPGRSIKGTCALTEFEVEAAPADRPDKAQEDQDRPGHGRRRICRRRLLEPMFDDKSKQRESPGRSNSPSTARTTRPGASTPARACATSRARPCS